MSKKVYLDEFSSPPTFWPYVVVVLIFILFTIMSLVLLFLNTKEVNKGILSQVKVVSISIDNINPLTINQQGNYVTIESKAVKTNKETKDGHIYQILIPDTSYLNQAAKRCAKNTTASEPTFVKYSVKQLIPDLKLDTHNNEAYFEEVIAKTILTCK